MNNIFPWQQTLWNRLIQSRERLPHAFLITGNAGVGKVVFGQFLAAWLLCTEKTDQPCLQCRACTLNKTHQHPDFYELSYEQGNTLNIDVARLLKEKLSDSAQQGGARVVLIKAAEKLTTGASNALLKILEEPPSGVYFILVTDRPILLPITLRSRCQLLHCPIPTHEESVAWLKTQITVSDELVNKALHWVSSAPLYAKELLKDSELFSQREQMVNEFLSVLQGKLPALTLAHRWASLEEDEIFPLVDYVIRRAVHLAYGTEGTQKSFSHVPIRKWFYLHQEMLTAQQKLWEITGLNRQLFWEDFLFKCEAI